MQRSPSSDEKIMAALAHGSIFLMFLGPVVPVILWTSQHKKSKYVSFHALQAMGYQVLVFWLWMIVPLLIVMLTTCLVFPLGIFITENPRNMPTAIFAFQIFIIVLIFGSMGLFFLIGLIGGVFCLMGHHFHYPVIGKWLERHLPYSVDSESQIDEAQEENWVAGVCHATAVLQLWGLITPLIVWFTQRERSTRLRFQSMQALVYQGIALAVYIIGMALYMFSFFGMMIFMLVAAGANKGGEVQGPVGLLFLIFFGVIMIFAFVSAILAPIYYLLAGLAAIRVIQGRPFHYPILGGILERRMQTPPKLEATS